MITTSVSLHSENVRQAAGSSILVVRLGAMGDLIHAMAAISSLRAAIPDCRIGWVVESRWSPLMCAFGCSQSGPRSEERPLVDEIFCLDTRLWRRHPASPATWKAIRGSFASLRSARYDAAIDIQGAIRSAIISRMAGVSVIWGEAITRESLASMFYGHRIAVTGSHVIEQNLSLVSKVIGVPLQYHAPALPSDAGSRTWFEANQLGLPYCLLNPGAGWGAKCWPAASFAEVARQLSLDGMHCVVNFGPGEEALAQEVMRKSGGAAKAISCSISQLIELTRHAALFIGGDTGPMHLAAALRVPVVALFGPTNPARNGPFGTRNIVLRSKQSATSYSHTNQRDDALQAIPPAEVIAAARKLLEEQAQRAMQEQL